MGIAKSIQHNDALKKEKKEALATKIIEAEQPKNVFLKSSEPYSFAKESW